MCSLAARDATRIYNPRVGWIWVALLTAERLIKELHTKNVKLVLKVTPVSDRFSLNWPAAGITYCHVPMLDNSSVPIHDVQRLVHSVVEEMMRGKGVMIHCNQGNNRSPLIAILAIIKLTGCEPTEAVRQAIGGFGAL